MMISIMVTDENLAMARAKAKLIEQFSQHTALSMPLSASGEAPPTHWFCAFNASEETLAEIRSRQEVTEVVEMSPREFLKSRSLKMIPMHKYAKWNKDREDS